MKRKIQTAKIISIVIRKTKPLPVIKGKNWRLATMKGTKRIAKIPKNIVLFSIVFTFINSNIARTKNIAYDTIRAISRP